jgi:hypothetical protein
LGVVGVAAPAPRPPKAQRTPGGGNDGHAAKTGRAEEASRSRDSQTIPHPEISPTIKTLHGLDVPVMRLHDLVLTRLNSERTIDRVSIRSMDAAGLITADVEAALPEKALSRLQNIRDTE